MELFASPLQTALLKALDAAALRQRVIADNLANVDTPGFKKGVVRFEEELKRALNVPLPLKTTDPRHFPSPVPLEEVSPRVERDYFTSMRADGNNVDVDEQMVNLLVNALSYHALTQVVAGRYASWHYVINGGR
ncbi:flagellar basal body rod protein FlgB [Ammonifex thiophilus]|uniref:Flagellar basal body rod protein FlgB n=1 Tax=Ammonifex thiophilus TaxID=444093 RepID=A0A3D8P7Q1_9THEO|nr:flagellar basal body rod protein FlgB [Ammonifex thiophilus]RDV84668.1 flagellar basal body rod protein FlgB [Ammonifex thiophilus]